MKAAILAGGMGTRLRTAVPDRPKPMALVRGTPFLAYLLAWVGHCGVHDVVICAGYRWEAIKDYFGDGSSMGLRIEYSVESSPLGTGGALKQAASFLEETFFVLNGDSYLPLDLISLADFHAQRSALASVAVAEVPDASACGSVTLDAEARIIAFREKQTALAEKGSVNAGIYCLQTAALDMIPAGQPSSLEYGLFPEIIRRRLPIFGYRTAYTFLDIGTPERFHLAQTALRGEQGNDHQG